MEGLVCAPLERHRVSRSGGRALSTGAAMKNNKYEMQQALLWNMRCLRSGFGKQVYSAKITEPGVPIGSSVRDAFAKQYASAEQTRKNAGNNSQGAIYKCYGSMGQQCESIRPSSARAMFCTGPKLGASTLSAAPGPGNYKHEYAFGAQRNSRRCTSARAPFGSETRDTRDKRYMDHELETSFCGRGTPGPVYGFQQSVGRQVLSTKTTGGRATMGKAARFGGGRVDGHTPDLQTGTSAIGRQTHSARATLPSYGFGTSTRDGAKAVFLSKAHGKALHGIGTPGPGTGERVSAFQRQKTSQKATQPAFGFGSSSRALRAACNERSPGPGTYCA